MPKTSTWQQESLCCCLPGNLTCSQHATRSEQCKAACQVQGMLHLSQILHKQLMAADFHKNTYNSITFMWHSYSAYTKCGAHTMRNSLGVPVCKRALQGVLLDQFGVLHDGIEPYPHAVAAVKQMAEQGQKILILSNSSRRKLP